MRGTGTLFKSQILTDMRSTGLERLVADCFGISNLLLVHRPVNQSTVKNGERGFEFWDQKNITKKNKKRWWTERVWCWTSPSSGVIWDLWWLWGLSELCKCHWKRLWWSGVVSSWTCGCRGEFYQRFGNPQCPRSLACCTRAWAKRERRKIGDWERKKEKQCSSIIETHGPAKSSSLLFAILNLNTQDPNVKENVVPGNNAKSSARGRRLCCGTWFFSCTRNPPGRRSPLPASSDFSSLSLQTYGCTWSRPAWFSLCTEHNKTTLHWTRRRTTSTADK